MKRTDGPKILYIDIETAPFAAVAFSTGKTNLGYQQITKLDRMLGFGARWHGQRKVEFYSEFHHTKKVMVKKAFELLDEADIVIHYNGNRFDIPWLKRVFKENKLPQPSPFKQIDLYPAARTLKLPSYRLDFVSQFLGLGGKVKHTGLQLWLDCMSGDPKAWARMAQYCKQDVRLLEGVYLELRPLIRNHPNVNLYKTNQDSKLRCPACGSDRMKPKGFAYTAVSKYPQYFCSDCGRYTRGKHKIAEATAY